MEEVNVGTVIGRKTIIQIFEKGPYTYCITRCQCGRVQKKVPLGMLTSGQRISCQACWNDEMREVKKEFVEAIKKARQDLCARRKAEAEAIRKRFHPNMK